MAILKTSRIGEKNTNNQGIEMIIINYINSKNILIQFLDEYKAIVKTQYYDFKKGRVSNPFYKGVCHIGFLGVGKFKFNNKSKVAVIWRSMLIRCYDERHRNNNPTYKNCTVCDEWHNFQNFAEWFENNYYDVDNQQMQLDKDILHKGNKVYSPENCVFVPNNINSLFIKCDKTRGQFPLGVSYDKLHGIFRAYCNDNNGGALKYLGCFNNIEEAFNIYKLYKETLIKKIANKYKDKIPKNLYDAMYNYIVEITD